MAAGVTCYNYQDNGGYHISIYSLVNVDLKCSGIPPFSDSRSPLSLSVSLTASLHRTLVFLSNDTILSHYGLAIRLLIHELRATRRYDS